MSKIKNISNYNISIFYFKNGKSIRSNLKPGEEVLCDSKKTPQMIFFENNGKISITNNDSTQPIIDVIITHGAIYPTQTITKEQNLNNNLNVKKEYSMDNIIELVENNFFDYKNIFENNVSVIYDEDTVFDISLIIPIRGRNDFAEPMYNSFISASEKSGLKISYTMVEHSENPEHSKFCRNNKLNYIWIKSEPGELFNKCLAQNMGAIFSTKSKYILFHDIDCLMQSDFFIRLLKNIENKKARAIQNFTGRRVLYISPYLTSKVVSGDFPIDELSINLDDITPSNMVGAPGGSITIERDLFFDIGGYDPELFLANSPEDAFFWEKVDTIDKMHVSDSPDIELYHMYHLPTYNDNPHISEMLDVHNAFKSLTQDSKIEIINLKSEIIKKIKK